MILFDRMDLASSWLWLDRVIMVGFATKREFLNNYRHTYLHVIYSPSTILYRNEYTYSPISYKTIKKTRFWVTLLLPRPPIADYRK